MDKTVWTLLSQDLSGDCVQVFSTYEKALHYAKGLMKDIGGTWKQSTDTHWTYGGESDIYIEQTTIDKMSH